MFGGPPFGQRIGGNVNLSTGSSSSFASLLDNVRAERQQRDEQARLERAVLVIQRRWRACGEGARVRREVVSTLTRVGRGEDEDEEEDAKGIEQNGARVRTRASGPGGGANEMLKAVVISHMWRNTEMKRLRGDWARRVIIDGAKTDSGGIPILLQPIGGPDRQGDSTHGISIALAMLASLDSLTSGRTQSAPTTASHDPAAASSIVAAIGTLLEITPYKAAGDAGIESLRDIVEVLGRNGWVERVVEIMKDFIATNTPKKKNPALIPLTRLVLAPLRLSNAVAHMHPSTGQTPPSTLLNPLITHLLAIPMLPSTIPIPALTYLSNTLALFPMLLPYAAAHPDIITGIPCTQSALRLPHNNPLASEHGKTYLLANLVTFGITGQMLVHASVQGKKAWMSVLTQILSGLDEGWGRWVEGVVDEDEDVRMTGDGADSDDSDLEDTPPVRLGPTGSSGAPQAGPSIISPTKSRPRQTRPLLPLKTSSKLLLLPSPAHMGLLIDMIVSPSAKAGTADLLALVNMAGELMRLFRGTPKWEAILDALSSGRNGKQLFRRLWRECVRGRWGASGLQVTWEGFASNPHAAPLRLLSNIYNHFLLLAPDDEFFDPASNPLTMDEVLELSVIWRDLAFWGYMAGVSVARGQPGLAAVAYGQTGQVGTGMSMGRGAPAGLGGADQRGSEEDRGLFKRGVTRLTERNARRKFAPDDHWPMPALRDLSGFVEAAVLEEAQLFNPEEESEPAMQVMQVGSAQYLTDQGRAGNTRDRLASRQRLSKRQVSFMSPRLGLLNNLPMAVPFVVRLKVFDQLVKADAARTGADNPSRRSRWYNKATIRRDRLAEDGFRTLNSLGPYMKGHIQITFINEFGEEEAGIDGGGLFKEFLTSLSRDAFDSARGLWLFTDQNELYPNPHSYATEQHQLSWYAFLGRVLGKAIYDGILVDVSFAGFFLAKWLGRQSYLDDLASLDRDLYKGLIVLKNYPKPEELALNFTITEEEFGMPKTIDLLPGGADIAVTAENRHEYIQLVCRYKLDRRIALQSRAFFNGLSEIVDDKWLRMFDQHELRQVIGGEETPIDVDDLRANTAITGFAHDDTVKLFWRVVGKFSQGEKRALLKFVTSCERPPLLGFQQLNPKFGIRSSGNDTTRLPSASSCFNLLKLPEYKDEKTLKSKLLQAITSGAGFDLS